MTRPLPVPVRIVIADDRPISRDGLRRLLESDPSFVIVGATGACSEAAKLVRDQQADILLLDFPVKAERAFETLQDIARSGSAARVIILVRSLDGSDVVRAVQRGARGIVLKDSPTDPLFKSIQTVMEGQYWIALDHRELRRISDSYSRQKPTPVWPTVGIGSSDGLEPLGTSG